MQRTLLSLDFYGSELTALLVEYDEQAESIRILDEKSKRTHVFSSAFVQNLSMARKELMDMVSEMAREISTEEIDILVGLRGNFLSFQCSGGFFNSITPVKITASEIKMTLQDSIPKNLSDSMEEIDTLPIRYQIDGNPPNENLPLGLYCWNLTTETFLSFATKTHLHNLCSVFSVLNQPYQFLPTIVAMGESLLTAKEKNSDSLLLDVTELGTSAILYQNGKPVDAEELPIGTQLIYQYVADMIQDDLQTTQSIIENHKRGSDEVIDELLEDAECKLFNLIDKALINQSFQYSKRRPTLIVLAGQLANEYSLNSCKKTLKPKRIKMAHCKEIFPTLESLANPKIIGALSLLKHTLKQEKINVLLEPKPVENDNFVDKILKKLGLSHILS